MLTSTSEEFYLQKISICEALPANLNKIDEQLIKIMRRIYQKMYDNFQACTTRNFIAVNKKKGLFILASENKYANIWQRNHN